MIDYVIITLHFRESIFRMRIAVINSYQMKFAVNQALVNITPTEEQIGECLKKVLQYQTMSGRFDNRAHKELAEMGLERVEVTDQGLNFIGKQTDRYEGFALET